MGLDLGQIIEGTIFLIALFLVLTNADSFGTAAQAIGSVYTNSVKPLQARA